MGTQHRLLSSTLLETSPVGVDVLSLSHPLGLVSNLLSSAPHCSLKEAPEPLSRQTLKS